jgi:hypothetical protein
MARIAALRSLQASRLTLHVRFGFYSVLSSEPDGAWRCRSILSWRMRTISIVLFGAARYIKKWLPRQRRDERAISAPP